jgi:hypothetical protein
VNARNLLDFKRGTVRVIYSGEGEQKGKEAARCRIKNQFTRAAPSHLLTPKAAWRAATITVANLGMANGKRSLASGAPSHVLLIGVPEPKPHCFRGDRRQCRTGANVAAAATRTMVKQLGVVVTSKRWRATTATSSSCAPPHPQRTVAPGPGETNDGRAIAIVDAVGHCDLIGTECMRGLLVATNARWRRAIPERRLPGLTLPTPRVAHTSFLNNCPC